ncbi:MAG: FtsX-like permease family protein [Spirochaetota bacterium]
MIFKLALLNIKRNRKRSFLSSLSIFFAAIIIILAWGWIDGMLQNLIDTTIDFQTGTIKIASESYFKQEKFFPIEFYYPDKNYFIKTLSERLSKEFPKIKFEYEERLNIVSIAGKQDSSSTVILNSISSEKELTKYQVKRRKVEGNPEVGNKNVIIGKDLAKNLGLKPDDSFLLVTKTYLSGLNGIKVKVSGIVDFGIGSYNKSIVLMDIDDAKELAKLSNNSFVQYLIFFDIKYVDSVLNSIKNLLSNSFSEFDLKAVPFSEGMGQIYGTMMMMKKVLVFVFAFILFLASFIIINTMMMNIFERINEIGTLMAIGTTKKEIFLLNFYEGSIIGILGGLPGSLIGYLIAFIMNKVGFDFSTLLSGYDMLMNYIIRPSASLPIFFVSLFISCFIPSLATIIPSRYASRLLPTEALRHL